MKAELGQSSYRVSLDMCDVDQFASRWPCYGERSELAFVFDRNNGDLIDVEGEEAGTSEAGLAALANDAALAGAIALDLRLVAWIRRPYGDPNSTADMLAAQ
jgi:hypothetical protein